MGTDWFFKYGGISFTTSFILSDRHFGCKGVLSASVLKSEKTIKQAKRLTKWSPHVCSCRWHKKHEKFFNFTKHFFLFKRQISLRCWLISYEFWLSLCKIVRSSVILLGTDHLTCGNISLSQLLDLHTQQLH